MLRTCSEPDMTKLFNDEDLVEKEAFKIEPVNDSELKNNKLEGTKKTSLSGGSPLAGTVRLARSLEDVSGINKNIPGELKEVI